MSALVITGSSGMGNIADSSREWNYRLREERSPCLTDLVLKLITSCRGASDSRSAGAFRCFKSLFSKHSFGHRDMAAGMSSVADQERVSVCKQADAVVKGRHSIEAGQAGGGFGCEIVEAD